MGAHYQTGRQVLAKKALEDWLAVVLEMVDMVAAGVSNEPAAVSAGLPIVHDDEPRYLSKQGLTPAHDAIQQEDIPVNIINVLIEPMGADKAELFVSLLV